jgi:hypothetical protein
MDPQKSIIAWSLTRHRRYRRRYAQAAADPRWAHLAFIRLQSRRQVDAFVSTSNRSPAPLDQGAR